MFGFGYYFDPTILILIPAIIFALWAQSGVNGTFNKYDKIANRKGLTGADVAEMLLRSAGITDVRVERVPGRLTDHYDPRAKVLRLSDSVYASRSLAAVGVAAHETGHAMQHSEGYMPIGIRNAILPVANIGSQLAFPLVLIGLFLSYALEVAGSLGIYIAYFGIALFVAAVLFQVVTLPVEFNASRRALQLLGDQYILTEDELTPARKVLRAAAMTYVAALAVSLANLLRLIMIVSRRRD
ncbi:MAG: zinc metallopeptidase [Clostridiales bacterium]|jgi:Zn-dependent membrane protease YugP|nr:zinc metallopeptidase [Clostridiales bacterium]